MDSLFLVLLFTFAGLLPTVGHPPQTPPQQLDPLLQLMITQPSIEVATNVQAAASFDPPVVRPGQKSIYRVTFNALSDSVVWPDRIEAPPELVLRFSARGQTFVPAEGKLKPHTAINYHARAAGTGSFTIPEFAVQVYGQRVIVPAARLEVSAAAPANAPRSLELALAETNIFVGQRVNARVLMRSSVSNVIEGVQDLHFNGEGFLADQGAARQSISTVSYQGGTVATYSYEAMLTPLVSGRMNISAQGFTAGSRFSGAITIQGQAVIPGGPPQFLLVDSDPVAVNVRALPQAGQLPGFTGAIGEFTCDPPLLSTNQTRVGDLVKLVVTFRGGTNMARFIPPPPPASSNWQVFAAVPGGTPLQQPGAPPATPGSSTTFTYTLMPTATNASATPAIPVSYFDPKRAAYVDLTVPPVPIKVLPSALPVDARAVTELSRDSNAGEKKLKLSDLAQTPGRTTSSLVPLQRRGWFILIQLLPLAGFVALWNRDRRRRFLEQHPEIVRRRRARRALRRERSELLKAFQAGDSRRFASGAVNALRIAVAPHYPAEPRALVSRDVLEVLGENGSGKETVQRFFAVTDAEQFSVGDADAKSLLQLQPQLERVLNELEDRLR